MKQNILRTELLRDMSKAIAPLLIIAGICGMVLFFSLKVISLSAAKTPVIPEFAFDNVGPCLEPSHGIITRFEVGDKQYICADMKTNESPVYLELHIYTSDKKKQVYVEGGTFTPGPISFDIYPPLPIGRYWAKITWSRPALVDFEFEVVEKQ